MLANGLGKNKQSAMRAANGKGITELGVVKQRSRAPRCTLALTAYRPGINSSERSELTLTKICERDVADVLMRHQRVAEAMARQIRVALEPHEVRRVDSIEDIPSPSKPGG
jgi:hypothetical protein